MQEIMTVEDMRRFLQAAGQYANRIDELTKEIQELV